MAAVAATLSRSMKFEQLRAEMELIQAGHQHDQRRTTGFPEAGDRSRWM
jgi:hypothetical protein